MRRITLSLLIVAASMASTLYVPAAHAVPSFSRQTGLPCSACHTIYPALTPFGRMFKLNGYTMTNLQQLKVPDSDKAPSLDIAQNLPISVKAQAGVTNLSKAVPDQQNPASAFPQNISIYLAGAVSEHVGGTAEMSYDQDTGKIGLGMVDVRYANKTDDDTPTTYGLTFNNNPTLEDLWNSTPAYGFPFVASTSAPTPTAGPFISNMNVAGNLLGVGGYAKHGDWYGNLAIYRSATQGQTTGSLGMTTAGTSPYLRLAWSHDYDTQSLEFGLLEFRADYRPMATSPMLDRYKDTGIDGQYQYFVPGGIDVWEVRGSYIRESTDWAATMTSNPSDATRFLSLNGSWIHAREYGLSFGYFTISGDSDCLLYNGNAGCVGPVTRVFGSSSGNPNSNGYVAEFDYLPLQNLKLAFQYTIYNKFNGASSNYDGNGRNASDNNTLYVNVMLSF